MYNWLKFFLKERPYLVHLRNSKKYSITLHCMKFGWNYLVKTFCLTQGYQKRILIQKEFKPIMKCSKAKMISLQWTVVAKILRYILGVLGLFFDQINKFSDYSNVSTSQLGALHLHRILRICLNLVQKRLDWNPDQNWAKCPAMVCYILTMYIHTRCKPKSVGTEHLRCWSHETFLPYFIWKDELQTAPSDGGQMSLTAIRTYIL